MMLKRCIDDLLIRGINDWLQASEIASVAITVGEARTEEAIRELSLKVIRSLLESGFAVVGDVVSTTVNENSGGKFVPWSVPLEVALQRVDEEWRQHPKGPGLGDVCWLDLTELGASRGEALWSAQEAREARVSDESEKDDSGVSPEPR